VALRVIAGTVGGRRLVAPKGDARPTTDRLKEALFASLGPRTRDTTVLDLFCGSGALAIEALSRGARRAVLVDRDRAAASAVRANLDATGFDDRARFDQATVTSFLARPVPEAPFDLVFLDPPYEVPAADVAAVLQALDDADVVAADGTVVVERARGGAAVVLPDGWRTEKERAYGDTLLVVARAG